MVGAAAGVGAHLGWLGLASVLVATNWLVYVIAVNSNHVADAALGYYINPLVNVLLGLVFLSERLGPYRKLVSRWRRLQW